MLILLLFVKLYQEILTKLRESLARSIYIKLRKELHINHLFTTLINYLADLVMANALHRCYVDFTPIQMD